MITIERPRPKARTAVDSFVCRDCDGSGRIPRPNTADMFVCPCVQTRHVIRQIGCLWLGLFPKGFKTEIAGGDYLKTNLVFHGPWRGIARHAGLAISLHLHALYPTRWPFKIITDEDLRAANFADDKFDESSRLRPDDLFGSSVELLVLRLGFLGTKNAAMAGFIYTALRAREVARKPTWIIIDDDGPSFVKGHFSWSEDLARYIGENFTTVRVTSNEDPEEVASADAR